MLLCKNQMTFHPSKLDGGNSTIIPLAGDATFTGVFLDVLRFASISVIVNTDVAGTVSLEQSSNSTDIDYTISKTMAVSSVTNTAQGVYTIPINARYIRVKYVNGSAAQGHFRLQTVIQAVPLVPTNPPYEFRNSVKRGDVQGIEYAPMAGYNPSVDDSFSILAPFATNQEINTIAAASLLALASDNANDTSAGTGLQSLMISGLDAAGNEQAEILSLAGQTKVATANTYTAAHLLVGLSAGSGGENAGHITVGLDDDTFTGGIPDNDKYLVMAIGWNTSRCAYLKVPAGKTWYGDRVLFNSGAGIFFNSATVRILGKQPGKVWLTFIEFHATTSSDSIDIASAYPQPAGTELRIDAKVNSGTGPIFCSVNYFLVDD